MRTAKTLIRLADAQADLSLRWAHMPFCWFCHEAAHITKPKGLGPFAEHFTCHSVFMIHMSVYEPRHDKTNKMSAPSEDSDQPGHLPCLISLRCPHEESLGP